MKKNLYTLLCAAGLLFASINNCEAICQTPTGLTTTNITSNSAMLSWNSSGAISYQIRYRLAISPTWIMQSSISTTYSLTGLLPSSNYVWQVRGFCLSINANLSSASAWSALMTFQTLPTSTNTTCNAPTGLYANNITNNSASLHWNAVPNAVGYYIRYMGYPCLNSNSIWITTYSATNSVNIFNLCNNAIYTWQVESICMVSNSNVLSLSGWSASVTFNTLLRIANNTVQFDAAQDEIMVLNVYDFLGKLHNTQTIRAEKGINMFDLSGIDVHSGMYLIELRGSDQRQFMKVYLEK